MQLDPKMFIQLLNELDVEEAAQHSCANHHVNGMNYLCLSRTKDFTIKLYMMEQPINPNSGYLVNPHSHRYDFASVLLRGNLEHIRFYNRQYDWNRNDKCSKYIVHAYSMETGELSALGEELLVARPEIIKEGQSYWVDHTETHTLKTVPDRGPLVLGLMQFKDVQKHSMLYLPSNHMAKPTTMKIGPAHAEALRVRALQLIGG